MSNRAIHKSLQQRVDKVARFLADALTRLQELPRCNYVDGEEHLYLGNKHPLSINAIRGGRGSVILADGHIRISTVDASPEALKKKLIAWYRQQARQYFNDRIQTISKNAPWVQENTPSMRLRKMKRTWGSCSSRGVITLNPRLIKAPPACIEYVIAHELCHLREMNHSKAFYALQAALYPPWQESREHLREQAHIYLHE
jgi:predicted metal-dependent hydrolase